MRRSGQPRPLHSQRGGVLRWRMHLGRHGFGIALRSVAGLVLLSGCSVFGVRSGYEQPAYTVLERIGETVEIRRYGRRLAAEATVEAGDAQAGRNEAFKVLFGCISGANHGPFKVAMTTPVEVDTEAEVIAMTAPVETGASDKGRYTMRFFLPGSYTKATAPEPTDARVQIIEVPEARVAVLRFSGSPDEDSVETRKAELMKTLANSAWSVTGTPTALFYDPPWTLPFLRRNEVAVAVSSAPAKG